MAPHSSATRMVYSSTGSGFNQKSIINQFETVKQLGEGGFGSVYLAKNALTNELVAIKYIDISESRMLLYQ